MTTPRFTFPLSPVETGPAFVAIPAGVFGCFAVEQVTLIQQVYRVALERTRAVLAPSAVEKLYYRSAN
jgi:hypothetical protein